MQELETAWMPLADFCRLSGFAEVCETPAGRRDASDALATAGWFREIHRRSGWASAYAIEGLIEPETRKREPDRDRCHRNKWPKYELGLHRPHPDLVERAESEFPGSSRFIDATLWVVLKSPPESQREVTQHLRLLDRSVQERVGKWRRDSRSDRAAADRWLAGALERTASLDTLAATLLLCQEAVIGADSARASAWARQTYRHLIIVGEELVDHGVARATFELIELRLLRRISHEGWRYLLPASLYVEAVGAAQDVLWNLPTIPHLRRRASAETTIIQQMLDGKIGWPGLCHVLNPMRTLTSDDQGDETVPSGAPTDIEAERERFAYAWRTLRCGGGNHWAHSARSYEIGEHQS